MVDFCLLMSALPLKCQEGIDKVRITMFYTESLEHVLISLPKNG